MRFLLCFSYFIYYICFFNFLFLNCVKYHIYSALNMQIVALSKVKSKAPPTVPSSFPPKMNHPWIALWVWKILAVQFLTIAILPFIIWQECLLRIPPPPLWMPSPRSEWLQLPRKVLVPLLCPTLNAHAHLCKLKVSQKYMPYTNNIYTNMRVCITQVYNMKSNTNNTKMNNEKRKTWATTKWKKKPE